MNALLAPVILASSSLRETLLQEQIGYRALPQTASPAHPFEDWEQAGRAQAMSLCPGQVT